MLKIMEKRNARILGVLLSLMLVLGTMCTVPAFASQQGGEGTYVVDGLTYNFAIYDFNDLKTLESKVETQSAGSVSAPALKDYDVILMDDITIPEDAEWDGIGLPQSFKGFMGTFNGNGKTITTYISNSSNVGPKGGIFNLVGSDLSDENSETVIENLNITGDVSSNRFIGGVVGRVMGNLDIENCSVNMDLDLSNGASNSVGGLIGQCGSGAGGGSGTSGDSQGTVNVTECSISGTFTSNTSNNPVGGMFGHIYSGYTVVIADSAVSASLSAPSGTNVGAYIGNNAGVVTLKSCQNTTGISANAGTNNGTITVE